MSYTPSGSVEGRSLTVANLPSHNHSISFLTYGYSGWPQRSVTGYIIPYNVGANAGAGTSTLNVANTGFQASIGYTGSGTAHNHGFTGTEATLNTLSPYLSVYMWRRTA